MKKANENEIGKFKELNKLEKIGLRVFFNDFIKGTFGFEISYKDLIYENDGIRLNGEGIEYKKDLFINGIRVQQNDSILAEVFNYNTDKFEYYTLD